jgi:hypothetical protein
MDDWIALTARDLEIYLMKNQLELLQTVVLSGGECNPLFALIMDTVRRIRRDIATGRNQLSKNPQLIPAELRSAACALILEKLQGRIPSLKLSEEQLLSANNARHELDSIANGEKRVSRPLYPSEDCPYGFMPIILRVISRLKVSIKSLGGL